MRSSRGRGSTSRTITSTLPSLALDGVAREQRPLARVLGAAAQPDGRVERGCAVALGRHVERAAADEHGRRLLARFDRLALRELEAHGEAFALDAREGARRGLGGVL